LRSPCAATLNAGIVIYLLTKDAMNLAVSRSNKSLRIFIMGGLRYVLVQGGEPTIRKDLIEVLQDLDEIGFGLSLITNGTRLTQSFIN